MVALISLMLEQVILECMKLVGLTSQDQKFADKYNTE